MAETKIQTVQDLIHQLEEIKRDLGPEVTVLRGDNSGGYEAIRHARVEDSIEILTRKSVKAVVLS